MVYACNDTTFLIFVMGVTICNILKQIMPLTLIQRDFWHINKCATTNVLSEMFTNYIFIKFDRIYIIWSFL